MRNTRLLRPVAGAALVLFLASACGAAFAQQDQGPPDSGASRIDRLEKQLREVRQIVLQARATGAPVEIKEAGPDPQVTGLTTRFDDMEQTLTGLTGQLETLQHDLRIARGDAADAKAQNAALADRLTKLEAQMAALAPAAAPAAQGSGQPPADGGLTGQAAQGGSPPPPPPIDPKAAYANADQLMRSGDYDGAVAAFQDYVDHFGDTVAARPARYWIGEIKFMRQDYPGAALAYAGAIRGWPQTPWAPDALVRLSLSLSQMKQSKQACAALAEFGRRYPDASDAAKRHADAAKDKVGCVR